MNQTSNYGFNVPVGADIVNPLVQDFPNWDSLDTILRNVANTGIVTATHTKTGTIHTLSFSDTTVPMIRFQATADFSTNDTFTVNGLSVSALTVSGEALPDGAFVIGSMVLCELRDNLLTVYTSGNDASTLEGHPASYFATDFDLQIVDAKADANKVLIDQINEDLADLKWENILGHAALDIDQAFGSDHTFYMLVPRLNTNYLMPFVFFRGQWSGGDFATSVFFASNNYVSVRVHVDGTNHTVKVSVINQTGSTLMDFDLYGCNL